MSAGNLLFFALQFPWLRSNWHVIENFASILLWKVFEFYLSSLKRFLRALIKNTLRLWCFYNFCKTFLSQKKNNTNMFSSHCFLANVDSKGLLIAVFLQLNCMHTNIVTSSGYMNSVRVWFLFYQTRFYGASSPPPRLPATCPVKETLVFVIGLNSRFCLIFYILIPTSKKASFLCCMWFFQNNVKLSKIFVGKHFFLNSLWSKSD